MAIGQPISHNKENERRRAKPQPHFSMSLASISVLIAGHCRG
jgi:hypothetical protein